MTHFKSLLLIAFAGGLFGCDNLAVEDDMDRADFGLDIQLFQVGRENELNGPYATGTNVEFRVVGARESLVGWRYESSDPSVMEVMDFSPDAESGTIRAAGAGVAHITLLDEDGSCMEEFDVEVADVASVGITSRAILESEGETDIDMAGETIRVLQGGTATFRARFFDATGREVRGRDLLSVRGEGATTSMTDWSAFSAWLRVSPFDVGEANLDLRIGEASVGTLNIVSIAPDSLEGIDIVGNEEDAMAGDEQVLRATGLSEGNAVYGVEPEWLENTFSLGRGDLYAYTYNADIESDLRATYETTSGVLDDSMVVHGALGRVSSSAQLGCSVGSGDAGFGTLLPMGLALLMLRRRRR